MEPPRSLHPLGHGAAQCHAARASHDVRDTGRRVVNALNLNEGSQRVADAQSVTRVESNKTRSKK